MDLQEKAKHIWEILEKEFPAAQTELTYQNPYQLLVAVILSAQCTDKRVNMVTPALFERFPTPEHLSDATFEEVFECIKSISYPNNKAKNLIGMAKKLVSDFQSVVPETIEELTSLPGVGRKTANVIASVVYEKPALAVDTHVFRVSNRLGIVQSKNPLDTEKQLMKLIPIEKVAEAHHWLILLGRYICKARKPDCINCKLTSYCTFYEQQ